MTVLHVDNLWDRLYETKWENTGSPFGSFVTGRHASGPTGAFKFNSASAVSAYGANSLRHTLASAVAELYVGTAMRHDGSTASGDTLGALGLLDAADNWIVSVNHMNNGNIEFREGDPEGTLLATQSTSGALDWKHVAIGVNATAGTALLFVDGAPIAESTGLTLNQPQTALLSARQPSGGLASRTIAVEDAWVATANIGDARVIPVRADAAGAAAEWDPSDGVSANWEMVGGLPPDLDEYVSTDVDGARDSLALPTVHNDAGRPEVLAVVAYARGSKTDGTTRELAAGMRVGTTYYDGTAINVSGIVQASKLWEANPDTSAAWTLADVAAAEVTYVATKP